MEWRYWCECYKHDYYYNRYYACFQNSPLVTMLNITIASSLVFVNWNAIDHYWVVLCTRINMVLIMQGLESFFWICLVVEHCHFTHSLNQQVIYTAPTTLFWNCCWLIACLWLLLTWYWFKDGSFPRTRISITMLVCTAYVSLSEI